MRRITNKLNQNYYHHFISETTVTNNRNMSFTDDVKLKYLPFVAAYLLYVQSRTVDLILFLSILFVLLKRFIYD